MDSNLYTWSNKDRSQQSRIDFWLISSDIVDKVIDSEIEPSILTDHKAITVKTDIKLNLHSHSKEYWKFNKTLLQNQELNNTGLKLSQKILVNIGN